MKVKINNRIYDAIDVPIMLILSKEDKENISNMSKESFKYCCYPNDYFTKEEVVEFMKIFEIKGDENE